MLGLGLRGLSLGQRGGGGAPVLSNFVDNLDQDPPACSFDCTQAGTMTWDFHSSITPPAAGAGDIATGSEAVSAGSNPVEIDLSAYPDETGYIHIRVTSGGRESNILTSQQITTPSPNLFDKDTVTVLSGTRTGDSVSITNGTIDIEAPVAVANGSSYVVQFTAYADASGRVVYIRLGNTTNVDDEPISTPSEVYSQTLAANGTNEKMRLIFILHSGATGSIDLASVSVVPA